MTGYGRAVQTFSDRTITVEIRSLNSKFTDLRFKIPQSYREKEVEMRKIISGGAQRGKVDVNIDVKSLEGDSEYALNKSLFRKYHSELSSLAEELKINSADMLQSILRLPNVVAADERSIDEEEWNVLNSVIRKALENFTKFRIQEGAAMEKDCTLRVTNIAEDIDKLDPFEAERVVKLRDRIRKKMEEYVGKENIDANRFEQEILYYLEKIDITEEKVRLAQHCKYFLEVLSTEKSLKGRKLSFISQEMGREINTLGSKANSSEIQRIVVRMKDELEKIKEQVANSV